MTSAIRDGNDAMTEVHDQYIWIYFDYYTHPAQHAKEFEKWKVFSKKAPDQFKSALREVLLTDTTGMMVGLSGRTTSILRTSGATSHLPPMRRSSYPRNPGSLQNTTRSCPGTIP